MNWQRKEYRFMYHKILACQSHCAFYNGCVDVCLRYTRMRSLHTLMKLWKDAVPMKNDVVTSHDIESCHKFMSFGMCVLFTKPDGTYIHFWDITREREREMKKTKTKHKFLSHSSDWLSLLNTDTYRQILFHRPNWFSNKEPFKKLTSHNTHIYIMISFYICSI